MEKKTYLQPDFLIIEPVDKLMIGELVAGTIPEGGMAAKPINIEIEEDYWEIEEETETND